MLGKVCVEIMEVHFTKGPVKYLCLSKSLLLLFGHKIAFRDKLSRNLLLLASTILIGEGRELKCPLTRECRVVAIASYHMISVMGEFV